MAKILIIDDDKALSHMVEDWLLYEKHDVQSVHTGQEGWGLLKNDGFDLVLLDWDLPDLNGIDILNRYRDAGGTAGILMLTGHTTIDDKEAGLDSGANDYLTKPFHMKELSARIRAILRNLSAAPAAPKPLGSGNEEVLKKGKLSGTTLAARYEFLDLVGEGGAGMVFKAKHPHLDKTVAIKMLLASEMNEENIARFEREAKAISRLDHSNIIVVHDFGITENKQPFMVMDFVEGKALDVELREREFLPLAEALNMLCQVADGLCHAHEMGLLHRDIKPSNIMLKELPGKPPVPKILDFGLAKFTQIQSQKEINLTQAWQSIGSPPYMSPEQVRGKKLDERSDIYSLGCVMFEAFTGYPPHVGDTATEIMFKHLEEPPFAFEEVRPDMTYPPELEQLIAKALARERDDRVQTMREVADQLMQINAQHGSLV